MSQPWSWSQNGPGPDPINAPDNQHGQPGPQTWNEDTGVFAVQISHPPWIQRGSTIRFRLVVSHTTDGQIGTPARPFTTPLAATILDRYRQPVLAGYFTVGTVSSDPTNSNNFFVDVQVSPSCELEYFEIKWTATYTPVGSSTALPIQTSRGFKVYQPTKPGKHYFYSTKTFGAR